MQRNAVYVAATRQHVGKTSTCLGLLHGLVSKYGSGDQIGFLKPVGQQSVLIENEENPHTKTPLRVDRDVRVAKEIFQLNNCHYGDMSPVVIPQGYTRDFLDGKISLESQIDRIKQSFHNISTNNQFTVIEGTGHTGVGSIVNVNNARVAAELGVDMVLIANGGIGSAFDELNLNRIMCKEYGVKIRGVILNKVHADKVEMMWEYFPKALKSWGVPLIGVVPDLPNLAYPSMMDYEELFDTQLLCGKSKKFTPFTNISLVTSGLRRFLMKLAANSDCNHTISTDSYHNPLFVAHASRNDIILGFLSHVQTFELKYNRPYGGGMILTGKPPEDQPQAYIMEILANSNAPVLYAPNHTYQCMEKISKYTAKYNALDSDRVLRCAKHYAEYIDFPALMNGEV